MSETYKDRIKVTQEEKNEIKKNGADKMPLNPTAQGWSGQEIRKKLAQSVTGNEGSVLSLIENKINLVGDVLDEIPSVIDNKIEEELITPKEDIIDLQNDKADKTYVDSHLNNKSNPHEVTADEVGAYDKEKSDNRFAPIAHISDKNNPHEVKGTQITVGGNEQLKDLSVENAIDYLNIERLALENNKVGKEEVYLKTETFNRGEIDNKDAIVLQEAKEYADSLEPDLSEIEQDIEEIKEDYVTKVSLNLQLLEKLNIRPNGSDLLVIDGKINSVYIDSLYATDIETVNTEAEMLALPDMKRGDIAIVQENNSSYILKQEPSNDIDNWAKFLVQPSVISVNGKTGVVHIGISDIENLQSSLNSKLNITTYESDKAILEQSIVDLETNKVDKEEVDQIETDIIEYVNQGDEALDSAKINKTDIVNDLVTGGITKVLSAEQGKILKQQVDDRYNKTEVLSLLSILDERIDRLESALNWSTNLLELVNAVCWTGTCTSALETDLIDALCWTGTCENASSSNLVLSLQWT